MKKILLALLLFLLPLSAQAAISAQTVWEVRSTGSDNNGGGFVAGAAGTDYSQQNSAQYTAADLSVDPVTNTKVQSATHSFVSADVGNILHITAGTGFTTGYYQILSVSGGEATLDRSPGAVAITGGTYAVGGALGSFAGIAAAIVSGNKAFIKGSFTTASMVTFSTNGGSNPCCQFNQIIGYGTTRGDNGQATIQATASMSKVVYIHAAGYKVENITADCNNQTSCTSMASDVQSTLLLNNKVTGWTVNGIQISGNSSNGNFAVGNEVYSGNSGSGAGAAMNVTGGFIGYNYIHDVTGLGLYQTGQPATVAFNVVANVSGASFGDCITLNFNSYAAFNNTVYNCGRDGISMPQGINLPFILKGNLISNTGGYGMSMRGGNGTPAAVEMDGNAFYSTALGNHYQMSDTTVNSVNNVAPYTYTYDVTLTNSPFVSTSTPDYSLNTTAGGGAAARGTGRPAAWPGLTASTGYPSFGAIQPNPVTNVTASGGSFTFGN